MDAVSKHNRMSSLLLNTALSSIGNAVGGIAGFFLGKGEKAGAPMSLPEVAQDATTTTVTSTGLSLAQIQFPSYYVSARVVGPNGWTKPQMTGIGTYNEEVGMFKVMQMAGDMVVWDQKLDYISGSRQYRDRTNALVFTNVCPDTPIGESQGFCEVIEPLLQFC